MGTSTVSSWVKGLITAIDTMPAGTLSSAAKKLGIGVETLAEFVWTNQSARNDLIADIQAGNWQKGIDDLMADWKTANTPTTPVTGS